MGKATVRGTAGAASWGVTAQGRYGLTKGQALVVTVDPLKARYLGLMLGDAWGRSIDYAQHTSSLNNSEVTPIPDGTITYVISSEFPGKFNWLDTGGVRHGLLMIRWEFLAEPYDKATRGEPVKTELTTIAALRQGLSRSALERAQRRHRYFVATHRQAAYAARLQALYPARKASK